MNLLGNGLYAAKHHPDALSVMEADLATRRRLGDSEDNFLSVQSNLANTYAALGQIDKAMRIERDVYSGHLRLHGAEDEDTLVAANNYALSLYGLQRFEEAKSLLRKTTRVARRVLGESHEVTLKLRWTYAIALYEDPDATLDDLREAVTTGEDSDRIARRVLGGAHPMTKAIGYLLRDARAALRARETSV